MTTAERLAQQHGVGRATIERDGQFADAVASYAHEIKTYALAKLGELLAQMPKATGTRGQVQSGMRGSTGSSASKPPVTSASTLADLGLDRKTAMVAQQLAALPVNTRDAIAKQEISLSEARRETKRQEVRTQLERVGDTRSERRCPHCGEDRLIEWCEVLMRWECAVCAKSWRADARLPREDGDGTVRRTRTLDFRARATHRKRNAGRVEARTGAPKHVCSGNCRRPAAIFSRQPAGFSKRSN
jgi:hypothetical protein